jgi:hypothetical protein
VDDTRGLVAGARRHLREADAAAVRTRLVQEEVREGPADVDARNAPHHASHEAYDRDRRSFVYE